MHWKEVMCRVGVREQSAGLLSNSAGRHLCFAARVPLSLSGRRATMAEVGADKPKSFNRLAIIISVMSLIVSILSAIFLFKQTRILQVADKERNAAELCMAFFSYPILSAWRDEIQAIQVRRDRVARSSPLQGELPGDSSPPPVCTGQQPSRTTASWEHEALRFGAEHDAAVEDARRFRRLIGNVNNHLEIIASLWNRDRLSKSIIANCIRRESIVFREISINCLTSSFESTYPELTKMLSSEYFTIR